MSSYKKKYICHCLGVATLLLFLSTPAFALDIIPGLKGFGTDTRAAYGAANTPEICIVDSLRTTAGNPAWDATTYSVGVFKGTMRQCIEGLNTLKGETIDGHVVLPNSGKIILFETSGTIYQTGVDGQYEPYTYSLGSYTTIAGQTSPNPGILLRNILLYAGTKNDIFIQHIRGRMDGPPSLPYGNHKTFNFVNTSNIVIDHVSSAWGADTLMTFWRSGSGVQENFTVSNCLFAEPRKNVGLVGEKTSYSAKGFMIGELGDSVYPRNGLVYGNVFMNIQYRAPQLKYCKALIVNNYLYNNQDTSARCTALSGAGIFSFVGNVTKGGPMSSESAKNYIISTGTTSWDTPISQHSIYAYDNKCDAGTQASSSDWSNVHIRPGNATLNAHGPDYPNVKVIGENPPVDSPLWPTGLTAMASSAVKAYVIANAGAYPAFRDSLDLRFIDELTNNTGRSSLASGKPAAGDWPTLAIHKIKLAIPPNPHADDDGDGYTNLEEWLHSQAAIVEGKSSLSPLPPKKFIIQEVKPN